MSQLFETSAEPAAGYAHVALEQGIDTNPAGLTYAIPPKLADLAVGQRVTVPLGRSNKPVHGYVTRIDATCDVPADRIKSIIALDSRGISLPADLIELARWIAGYYVAPLGMVFATMLPAAVKRGTGTVQRLMVSLASPLPDPLPKLSKLQGAALDAIRELADAGESEVEVKRLADRAGARSISPVKQLIEKGVLTSAHASVFTSSWDAIAKDMMAAETRLTLNSAQQQAVDRLAASITNGFGVHLLHGVTGSGKTEVYLRAIEHLRERHPHRCGTIVLVPEIALTPQTCARFISRFGQADVGVAVLHSGLSAAQRHQQWQRIRSGEARIVVGARSAIFAPVADLGMIIVDEEHEQSYKQDQVPRYHARDVAIKRAQLLGVPVVLGSATPSLESYYNATHVVGAEPNARPAFHLILMPQRVAGLKLPHVDIVDMIEERRHRRGVHLLSRRLENAMGQTLEAGGQIMLLLNRRGYANYIACPDHRCGWMMTCDYCDATMVYHKDARLPAGGMVRCHHCTAEQLLPATCPTCSKKVTIFGLGTQRVEEELARKYPSARLARMDSDAMRTGKDYYDTLELFRLGQLDVLVGTQMIAKGLDFPNVRLVGVISADTSLHLPDFRAAERTFTLVAQVAGRAGRGDHPGKVVVQTFSPDDRAIHFASKHDYEGFAAEELKIRGQMMLPPVSRMARIVVRDRDHAACHERARKIADFLAQANEEEKLDVRLRGPAPCAIARIAEHHREQIEILAPPPAPASRLQKLLTVVRNRQAVHADTHVAIDVDPVSLL